MSVLSLSKQSGLVILEQIHQSSLQLESGYVKSWLPTLSDKNLRVEEELQCQDLNLEEVVSNYEAKLKRKEARKRRILKRVEGIPVGVNACEYITYRKCHYLYCVSKWRQSLLAVMTPQMMADLMELAITLFRHSKDRMTLMALTLQSVLCRQLNFLYINNSKVTDKGILAISGLEAKDYLGSCQKLSRSYKTDRKSKFLLPSKEPGPQMDQEG